METEKRSQSAQNLSILCNQSQKTKPFDCLTMFFPENLKKHQTVSFSVTDGEDQEHRYVFVIEDFANVKETIQLDARIMIVLPDEWEELLFSLFCLPDFVGNSLFTLRMDTIKDFNTMDIRLTFVNEDNSVIPFESENYTESSEKNSLEYTEYGNRQQIIDNMKGKHLKVIVNILMHMSTSEVLKVYHPRQSSARQVEMMMNNYRSAFNDQNVSDLKIIIHDINTENKEIIFVNKTMLMARSSYFQQILLANKNVKVLREKQFEIKTVLDVFGYMYGYVIEELESDVFKYLRIAHKYQLTYLLRRIDDFLCANIPEHDEDLIFLELAAQHDLFRLRRKIIQGFVDEKRDFVEFHKWKMLVADNPTLEDELMRVLIIEEDSRKAKDEEEQNEKKIKNEINNQSESTFEAFESE